MPRIESLNLPHRPSAGHGKAAKNLRSFAIEADQRLQSSPTTFGESFVVSGEIIDKATNRVAIGWLVESPLVFSEFGSARN